MAQQLALGGEERLRAMRLEQGLVGDIQPQLERLVRLVRRLARPGQLLVLLGEALAGLVPGAGRDRLVGACCLLHLQPQLHHLAHAALDGAEVGKARPLGHLADRLADLAAAGHEQRHRIQEATERLAGDLPGLGQPRHGGAQRAAEPQPRAPQLGHGRRIGTEAGLGVTFAGLGKGARELGLAGEPGLGQLGLLLVQLAAALGEILPGRRAHPCILKGSRPGGWRCRRAGGRSPD